VNTLFISLLPNFYFETQFNLVNCIINNFFNNQEVQVWRQVPLCVCLFSCVCVVTGCDCRIVCLTMRTKHKESRRHFNYRRPEKPTPPPPKTDPLTHTKNEPLPTTPAQNSTPSLNPNCKNEKSGLIDSAHITIR
jgi:hypothetical protein